VFGKIMDENRTVSLWGPLVSV